MTRASECQWEHSTIFVQIVWQSKVAIFARKFGCMHLACLFLTAINKVHAHAYSYSEDASHSYSYHVALIGCMQMSSYWGSGTAVGKRISRPAWPVAYAHLLACGWMNWIAIPRRCLIRCPSILLECPFDLAIFCWQNESECVNLITDDVFLFTYRLCTFKSWILRHESLQNIANFTKYSRTIGMHIHWPWITQALCCNEGGDC